MELCFTGRGAAFCPMEGNTSAYLREEDRLLLIDCGETVFERLTACHALDGVREATALITHLHPDHVGSLGSLAMYCYYALGFQLTVALPDDAAYQAQVRQLIALGGAAACCRWSSAAEVRGFRAFRSVAYVPTRHSPELLCFSLCFETEAGGVFYSGDTLLPDPLEAFLRTHPHPEAIYHEATLKDSPFRIHVLLSELEKVIPASLRPRVRLMHIPDVSIIEEGRRMGFETVRVTACLQKDE